MDPNSLYAAIDLGSNSFHLVIMAKKENKLVWVDGKKDMIRLVAGLDTETGKLENGVRNRALRCLNSFSKLIRKIPNHQIKAVGTSAFRQLADSEAFLKLAEKRLGAPIHILSGVEEAKYIYRGVVAHLPKDERFVIDIGGGSSEFILGDGKQVKECHSLELGCLSLTENFFPDNRIRKDSFLKCEKLVSEELGKIQPHFKERTWQAELGTSGSIKSVSWALQNLNLTQGEITREGMADLRELILNCETTEQLSKKVDLNLGRTNVFCAGFIILDQAIKQLHLSYIRISQGAIREGLIDEMLNP